MNIDGSVANRIYTADGRDVLRGTFANGQPQSEYTSKVVEGKGVNSGTAFSLDWSPVIPGSIVICAAEADAAGNGIYFVDDGNGTSFTKWTNVKTVSKALVADNGSTSAHYVYSFNADASSTTASATISYGQFRDVHDGDGLSASNVKGSITITDASISNATITYSYENEYVPQNDIPLLGVRTNKVYLAAKARRIAIYFSQLADFEAQKDYGYNLGDDLRKQAEFQLQYEIDVEVCENVKALGDKSGLGTTWYSIPPVGVNMRDHYATLAAAIAQANASMFMQTQKYHGTYLLVGPYALQFLSLMDGFKQLANNKFGYGPYVAGEFGGLKVIVTPTILNNDMYIGVNTPDASALIYGTYMPIVPTQLLQYADGGTSQGFSTLYDIEVLNANLVGKITVKDTKDPAVVITAVATPSDDLEFTDANNVDWTVAKAGD